MYVDVTRCNCTDRSKYVYGVSFLVLSVFISLFVSMQSMVYTRFSQSRLYIPLSFLHKGNTEKNYSNNHDIHLLNYGIRCDLVYIVLRYLKAKVWRLPTRTAVVHVVFVVQLDCLTDELAHAHHGGAGHVGKGVVGDDEVDRVSRFVYGDHVVLYSPAPVVTRVVLWPKVYHRNTIIKTAYRCM